MSDEIVKTLTRLETKVETIEETLKELKSDLKTSKGPLLPVAGGLAGVIAAACTAYLGATGRA